MVLMEYPQLPLAPAFPLVVVQGSLVDVLEGELLVTVLAHQDVEVVDWSGNLDEVLLEVDIVGYTWDHNLLAGLHYLLHDSR